MVDIDDLDLLYISELTLSFSNLQNLNENNLNTIN